MPRFSFLLALSLVAAIAFSTPAAGATMAAWKGGRTPALSLPDAAGNPRTLADWRGKVVIVNFWATWCEPCIEEMPSLERLKARLAHRGFDVIGVNLGEGQGRIDAFLKKTGVTFPILLDRDGTAKRAWKVNGAPATYLIDGKGRIRRAHVGALDFDREDLIKQVVGLLDEGSPKKGL